MVTLRDRVAPCELLGGPYWLTRRSMRIAGRRRQPAALTPVVTGITPAWYRVPAAWARNAAQLKLDSVGPPCWACNIGECVCRGACASRVSVAAARVDDAARADARAAAARGCAASPSRWAPPAALTAPLGASLCRDLKIDGTSVFEQDAFGGFAAYRAPARENTIPRHSRVAGIREDTAPWPGGPWLARDGAQSHELRQRFQQPADSGDNSISDGRLKSASEPLEWWRCSRGSRQHVQLVLVSPSPAGS